MGFQIKLTNISMTKGWSDQEVNTQIEKDLNPYATRPNFHTDNIYLADQKYNITYENIRGETQVRPIFIP